MGQLHRTDSVAQPSGSKRPVDSDALIGALEILAQERVRWSADDPQLRSALHDVALHVASSTSGSSLPNAASPRSRAAFLPGGSGGTTGDRLRSGSAGPRHSGQSLADDDVLRSDFDVDGDAGDRDLKPRYSDVSDGDLPLIIKRCRLKAEGTRWAVERDEQLRDGADFAEEIRPVDAEIIEQAKSLPNCFLWMNQPRNDTWTRADDYLLVADCFDTLADTLETICTVMECGNAEQFMEAVLLVAEAQSAVRCAVAQVETHADSDQQQTYHWLRNRASRDRFYISRFMRISDPAEPEDCDDVAQRAQKLKTAVENATPADQAGTQALRVRLKLLASVLSSQESEDWDEALEVMDGICDEDYQAILPELCQLLLPFEAELRLLDLPAAVVRLLSDVTAQNPSASADDHSADAA
ncbi:hypothetical protein GC176_04330 [bacterium]|nr:hypothetical protein [bacterium]